MKKGICTGVSVLLIILLGVQGKNIIDITNQKKVMVEKAETSQYTAAPIKKEVSPLSINGILDSIYTQSAQFKVDRLTLGEKGSWVEVEISLTLSVDEAEVIVNNIKKCIGFNSIKKYSEDAEGTKKLHIVFNNKSES